jgi:DNA replication protein DnaC
VKQGYSGWFIQFAELKSLYERQPDEMHFNLKKIRESEVLVIDEVTPPWSGAQAEFYAEKLEDAIRFRTHRNFPTIITTNMNRTKWEQHYPRVYHQLSGKQLRVEFVGQDYRSRANDEAQERLMNGERRPIV